MDDISRLDVTYDDDGNPVHLPPEIIVESERSLNERVPEIRSKHGWEYWYEVRERKYLLSTVWLAFVALTYRDNLRHLQCESSVHPEKPRQENHAIIDMLEQLALKASPKGLLENILATGFFEGVESSKFSFQELSFLISQFGPALRALEERFPIEFFDEATKTVRRVRS